MEYFQKPIKSSWDPTTNPEFTNPEFVHENKFVHLQDSLFKSHELVISADQNEQKISWEKLVVSEFRIGTWECHEQDKFCQITTPHKLQSHLMAFIM